MRDTKLIEQKRLDLMNLTRTLQGLNRETPSFLKIKQDIFQIREDARQAGAEEAELCIHSKQHKCREKECKRKTENKGRCKTCGEKKYSHTCERHRADHTKRPLRPSPASKRFLSKLKKHPNQEK